MRGATARRLDAARGGIDAPSPSRPPTVIVCRAGSSSTGGGAKSRISAASCVGPKPSACTYGSSARAIAAPSLQRSAGAQRHARARRSASSAGGTAAFSVDGGAIGRWRASADAARSNAAANSRRPVSISHSRTPAA